MDLGKEMEKLLCQPDVNIEDIVLVNIAVSPMQKPILRFCTKKSLEANYDKPDSDCIFTYEAVCNLNDNTLEPQVYLFEQPDGAPTDRVLKAHQNFTNAVKYNPYDIKNFLFGIEKPTEQGYKGKEVRSVIPTKCLSYNKEVDRAKYEKLTRKVFHSLDMNSLEVLCQETIEPLRLLEIELDLEDAVNKYFGKAMPKDSPYRITENKSNLTNLCK
ncbi:MAG: hypothetical protein FWD32_01415 [Firmicutes bacterium]|nr:hypothetical protein [Bacillota bacterium]